MLIEIGNSERRTSLKRTAFELSRCYSGAFTLDHRIAGRAHLQPLLLLLPKSYVHSRSVAPQHREGSGVDDRVNAVQDFE
jgi:hypothetical protein